MGILRDFVVSTPLLIGRNYMINWVFCCSVNLGQSIYLSERVVNAITRKPVDFEPQIFSKFCLFRGVIEFESFREYFNVHRFALLIFLNHANFFIIKLSFSICTDAINSEAISGLFVVALWFFRTKQLLNCIKKFSVFEPLFVSLFATNDVYLVSLLYDFLRNKKM